MGFDKNRNCFLTAHHFMPSKKRRTLVWALGFNLSEGPLFYRTHTKKYQGTGRVETLNQTLWEVKFMKLWTGKKQFFLKLSDTPTTTRTGKANWSTGMVAKIFTDIPCSNRWTVISKSDSIAGSYASIAQTRLKHHAVNTAGFFLNASIYGSMFVICD